ncbi:hypothetical protein ccbrp13_45400 [Ktedonobacteria bacterium brp13]|nr:hypothetical protein ccbrp13_45400 [Ktedonobacteria bacterium brp13]
MKSMSQSYIPVSEGPIEGSIIALTIITAIVHLLLAFGDGMIPMRTLPILWLLNGIGYLALLTALYLPSFAAIQPLVRWVLIAYTALTFIAWIIVTHAAYDPFDYTDKLIEIVIILLLIIEAFSIKRPSKA